MLLLLTLLGLTLAVDGQLEDRIVGGYEVEKYSVKYQASLQVEGRHYCGGSLIGSQWVLTAAHCLQPIKSMKVVLGKHSLDIDEDVEQVYNVSTVSVHPLFNAMTFNADIMLIKLHKRVRLNFYVQPVLLAAQDTTLKSSTCSVFGWGVENVYSNSLSNVLMGVEVPSMSQAACNSRYQGKITQYMICAGKDGKDSCKGDSGGPMVCNGKLEGIVSWGNGCASPQYPGVYTRVASFRNWIDRMMSL
ncbi:anionic trypsin-1-like [Rhinatrema bivittatum]|uniref:anionic trypsin-1-like n=1 Tax=Rhinatrema bivittatum TaxID=194408 RepID=UPI001129CB2A|nr:anionic trypsin-1-like [Rhinatrema bivittatum]